MVKLRCLELTDEIRSQLTAVARARDVYCPGAESSAVIELPKLALADAVLRAVAAQEAAREATLAALPRRQPVGVVEVTMRPKRSGRA